MIEYKDGQEVQIGDVVKLISGGPEMTVSSFCLDGEIWCCWFPEEPHHTSLLQESAFPVCCLVFER